MPISILNKFPKRALLAAVLLAGVALGDNLQAAQPTPKVGAKQESRKETRTDPCEPESPKKSVGAARKKPAPKADASRESTRN